MKNKLNFFLSALLVLLFITLSGSCFASTNYTIINESLNNFGYASIESNSNTTSVLNRKYVFSLFYNFNEKGEPQNLYIAGLDFDGYEPVIYGKNLNSENCYYYLSGNRFSPSSSTTFYGVVYDIDNNKNLNFNASISSNNVKLAEYSNYSGSYSLNEFKNYNFVKKLFINNILYSDFNALYTFNGSYSPNLLYKFDGIFKGNGIQEPYTSSFIANSNMFRFQYKAYTDLEDYNVVNYFFLQEFTPSQAINLTDEDLNFNDSDEQIVMNTKLESNFTYTSLIKRMQQGYIYRIYCFSNQQNQSGDLIRTTDSTSCFFSLNSWKSNAITVLNIYDIMFPENPDIEQEGGTSGGVIDLDNIENSINNSNKDYWGNPDNINPEDFENELENNFNGIMENLSGELTQNQIFESLQGAENGFLNFFKEEQNEQFYDLAFSWPDVEFMGGVLIPAGGINISEMCREIPALEQLRSYIRVIFNFGVAICLIKQIYNLILSTLGIDNPYLYEDYDEVTSINEDTGEYRQTAVRRKKIYNRRR